MEYILVILAIVIVLWLFLMFKFRKRKNKIAKSRIEFFEKRLKVIMWPSYSYREQILELDKLLHYVLKDLSYEGTLWDILKLQPVEITSLDEVWRLHKLRNKLAHDFDEIANTALKRDAKNFEWEIRKILKKAI